MATSIFIHCSSSATSISVPRLLHHIECCTFMWCILWYQKPLMPSCRSMLLPTRSTFWLTIPSSPGQTRRLSTTSRSKWQKIIKCAQSWLLVMYVVTLKSPEEEVIANFMVHKLLPTVVYQKSQSSMAATPHGASIVSNTLLVVTELVKDQDFQLVVKGNRHLWLSFTHPMPSLESHKTGGHWKCVEPKNGIVLLQVGTLSQDHGILFQI